MDRPASPSPSNSSHRDSIHDFGKSSSALGRRSQYRLFPVVGQTPPASPVALQRGSLPKRTSGSSRRSSSADALAKDRTSSSLSAAFANNNITITASTTAPAPTRDARKASLAEVHPLRTTTTEDRAPQSETNSFNRCVDQTNGTSSLPNGDRHAAASHAVFTFPSRSLSPQPLSPVVENPQHSARGRVRTKTKPNLRINVAKSHNKPDSTPPTPPPKTPGRLPSDSILEEKMASKSFPRTPLSANIPTADHLPSTPGRVLVAQQLTGERVQVRELTVFPKPAPDDSTWKSSNSTMHDLLPSDLEKRRLPPDAPSSNQQPSIEFSSALKSRPKTSDGPRKLLRVAQPSERPSTATIEPKVHASPNHQRPRSTLRSRLLPASLSRARKGSDLRPTSPEPLPQNAQLDCLSSQPTALADDSPDKRGRTPLRTIENSHIPTATSTSTAPQVEQKQDEMESPFEAFTPSASKLAAARAAVAALRISDSSAGTFDRSRASGSEAGCLSRRPSDSMLRRPSNPVAPDPVEALKSLTEETEALHIRYAELRAERQRISSGIVARLKEEQSGPEFVNTLLHDQLSLAAVSSSMDICFAKLKSLECRKEDAIAALIAKATQPQISPSDTISAMIASMAISRKPSLAPSTDSGRRILSTGRSTPDLGDAGGFSRLTQYSGRTISYGSEPEGLDYRPSSLARAHSLGHDSTRHSDSFDRHGPETIPEVIESPVAMSAPEKTRSTDQIALPVIEDERDRPPSADSDGLPKDLLQDQPTRIRVQGSKAAQILGLLGQDNSPLIKVPNQLHEHTSSHLELELRAKSDIDPLADGEAASPLSVRTKDTIDSPIHSSSDHDLESQLKSFPRPKTSSLRSTSDERRNTGGSFLTNGSSAESSYDEPFEIQTRVTARQRAPVATDAMKKRDPSAHTIQVYMEDEELMHYYNMTKFVEEGTLDRYPRR